MGLVKQGGTALSLESPCKFQLIVGIYKGFLFKNMFNKEIFNQEKGAPGFIKDQGLVWC